jgi:energy-coupling factor transporter ATP-binding protein EcfA2
MRVTKLSAKNVHGYLPVEVEFLPDLTFLIGLNGSGKTSALRLLMGLLTPAIDELARIEFSEAEVEVSTGGEVVSIRAVREADKLTVTVSGVEPPLVLDAPVLEMVMEPRRREEGRMTPIVRMLQESPVHERIRSISTPMFLGLERRLYSEDRPLMDQDPRMMDLRRKELLRRGLYEDVDLTGGVVGAGLMEVSMLVRDTMSEIRAKQERLDGLLRQRLLLSAVRFKPTEFSPLTPPDKAAIARYRERQAQLEQVAKLLRLPVEEVQGGLRDFFDNMSRLLESMDAQRASPKHKHKNRPEILPESVKSLMTWLVNKSQVDRILENLSEFEKYAEEREAVRNPIDRLLRLINKFLEQSKKTVGVTDHDRLFVQSPDGRVRSISALASGERQLLVMLGHLTLNERLAGSGVFIVDEPELSLHLSWQEMFVEAVRAANPDVQLIFATHSPAIIMDKDDHCRSLSGN